MYFMTSDYYWVHVRIAVECPNKLSSPLRELLQQLESLSDAQPIKL